VHDAANSTLTPSQNVINFTLLAIAVQASGLLIVRPETWELFPLVMVLSLAFGVLLIVPIGGAARLT
jgi:NAD(P) transhydrogenase subunit beta